MARSAIYRDDFVVVVVLVVVVLVVVLVVHSNYSYIWWNILILKFLKCNILINKFLINNYITTSMY